MYIDLGNNTFFDEYSYKMIKKAFEYSDADKLSYFISEDEYQLLNQYYEIDELSIENMAKLVCRYIIVRNDYCREFNVSYSGDGEKECADTLDAEYKATKQEFPEHTWNRERNMYAFDLVKGDFNYRDAQLIIMDMNAYDIGLNHSMIVTNFGQIIAPWNYERQ